MRRCHLVKYLFLAFIVLFWLRRLRLAFNGSTDGMTAPPRCDTSVGDWVWCYSVGMCNLSYICTCWNNNGRRVVGPVCKFLFVGGRLLNGTCHYNWWWTDGHMRVITWQWKCFWKCHLADYSLSLRQICALWALPSTESIFLSINCFESRNLPCSIWVYVHMTVLIINGYRNT